MTGIRLEHRAFPPHFARYIAERDAALWLGRFADNQIEAAARLLTLSWRMVLSEASSSALINAAEGINQQDVWRLHAAGFLNVVAADSEGLLLPPRSLPLFLLNGRQGAVGAEGTNPGRQTAQRRRLNHVHRLETSRPTLLVIATDGDTQPLDDFFGLWDDGFRTLVLFVTTNDTAISRIDEWLKTTTAPRSVDICRISLEEASTQLETQLSTSLAKQRIYLRFRINLSSTTDVDISECEMIERPLLDHYDTINVAALHPLLPQDLKISQLTDFFGGDNFSWEPFAAGVPWPRIAGAERKLLRTLESARVGGPEENAILYIISESGAGGTTTARALGYAAARSGYPTLVAKPGATIDASAVETFFHRVLQKLTSGDQFDGPESQNTEPAWLLVFDVGHWHGREAELRTFLADITRRGRRVVVLTVVSDELSEELRNTRAARCIGALRHETTRDEAVELGKHLNRFLAPHGKTRTEAEWVDFWNEHRPKIDTPIGSFWIALEFWLKGQLNLGESIQRWMYRQFSALDCTPEVRTLLLEIAALTVEREAMPEALMPWAASQEVPHSVALEEVRTTAPGLGLVRAHAGTDRLWAFAHVALGRYLISSVFFDRTMLEMVGLDAARDPIHLRLSLLGRIARRPEIARGPFRKLGVDFATRILKLDRGAAVEFFREWRNVLVILDSVPAELRDTSRTFNHHVAISRRRVATNDQYFDTTDSEKQVLLLDAIKRITRSLDLPKGHDEESDLNLLNSLSLAYQNLADCRQRMGADPAEVRQLHAAATEAARRAQQENSVNSYVLETLARNLLQDASLYPEAAVENAVQALSYVYQAMQQERSQARQGQLTKLVYGALKFLRAPGAKDRITEIARQGNPLGLLAEAWLLLTAELDFSRLNLSIAPDRALLALDLLDRSDRPNWMILRFRYDLLTIAVPHDFLAQLRVLDELEGAGYRMPLQLVLERAILLHQCGRHHEGSKLFDSLRRELQDFDVIVVVPDRLRWLLAPGTRTRVRCHAQVVDTGATRSRARVQDLGGAKVPFIPQDFGAKRMPVGMNFVCTINFGPMGPFAKADGLND